MNRRFAVGLLIMGLAACPPLTLAQEYTELAAIEAKIQTLANTSGGDASASKLKDAGGNDILTEGDTGPTNIWVLTTKRLWGQLLTFDRLRFHALIRRSYLPL
jgi:hypothetical protein